MKRNVIPQSDVRSYIGLYLSSSKVLKEVCWECLFKSQTISPRVRADAVSNRYVIKFIMDHLSHSRCPCQRLKPSQIEERAGARWLMNISVLDS